MGKPMSWGHSIINQKEETAALQQKLLDIVYSFPI